MCDTWLKKSVTKYHQVSHLFFKYTLHIERVNSKLYINKNGGFNLFICSCGKAVYIRVYRYYTRGCIKFVDPGVGEVYTRVYTEFVNRQFYKHKAPVYAKHYFNNGLFQAPRKKAHFVSIKR